MTTNKSTTEPRTLTNQELAGVIRAFRSVRQWSQETLVALSGLSVRTIQRIEKGDPSDLDTRRALARAFDSDDLDLFNKPYAITTAADLKKDQEAFEAEHLILDAIVAKTGQELARLFETVTMDMSEPTIELSREQSEHFAALVDYLREYRDCAELYSEVAKLDVYDELQEYIDLLDATGVSVIYASRKVRLINNKWDDKTPWPVTLGYLTAFNAGTAPGKIAVPKKVSIR